MPSNPGRRALSIRPLIRWGGPLLLLLVVFALRTLGDRWWPLLPLLFGPRWLLTPLALTPLLAFRRGAGRTTLVALALGVIAAAMLVDFRTGWRRLIPGGSGTPLRVVAWNAQGGGSDAGGNALRLAQLRPDLIVISECSPRFEAALRELLEMELYRSSGLCIVTALPRVEWAPRSPEDFWRMGGSGAIARLVVNVAGTETVIGAVHLETPRDALDELELFPIGQFRNAAISNQEQRDFESETARTWIAPPHEEVRPLIVAGDFNIPVESAIYKRWWGDLDNALSQTGTGLGWTKRTRLFGVRIDHVLTDNGIVTKSAYLGPAMGSDHRPVVVDLLIPQGISSFE
jgi:vancomycin resistance protein VanJ